MLGYFKNKSESIKEATNVLSGYRTELLNLDPNSETYEQDAAKIYSKTNTFVKLLPNDIAIEARKRANSSIPKPLIEGLREKMEQEKLKVESLNNG
jgi:hypothetical protein